MCRMNRVQKVDKIPPVEPIFSHPPPGGRHLPELDKSPKI